MPTFAVTYRYADGSDAARDETRPAHRAFLGEMTEQGRLLVSGPYVGTPPGALLVYTGESADEVRAVVADDPFVTAGLVDDITVREWTTVSGQLAPHF